MSSGRGGNNKKHYTKTKQDEEQDEVEKLLRATEDDILLKLSVDSHMSRGSSSHIIHPDLDRRFKALRSSSSPSNSKPPSSTAKASVITQGVKLNKEFESVGDGNGGEGDGDDLFARFAALKATLPSYSKERENNMKSENVGSDGVDGDEVDEVIRWAIDAAALDPSPPSDDDATDASSDDQTDNDDDDEEEDDDIKKKDEKKKKGARK